MSATKTLPAAVTFVEKPKRYMNACERHGWPCRVEWRADDTIAKRWLRRADRLILCTCRSSPLFAAPATKTLPAATFVEEPKTYMNAFERHGWPSWRMAEVPLCAKARNIQPQHEGGISL